MSILTDGACSGNPGPGGWGVLLRYGAHEKELFGGVPDTTNNRMEMMAVIEGLNALNQTCQVHIFTDSTYVLKGMTEWIVGWRSVVGKQPLESQSRMPISGKLWKLRLENTRLNGLG